MTTINRFSSRRQPLDHAFLVDRLWGAKSYKRIAGYFRSSIFELVGEEIASIPKVRNPMGVRPTQLTDMFVQLAKIKSNRITLWNWLIRCV